MISVGPVAKADIDLSDNLSPTLISISLAEKSLYPGQKTVLTLVIRDDKNELINLPINIQWRPPSDAPGYISDTNRFLSEFKVVEILKSQSSIQTTMTYTLTAPDWIGNFQGSALQGIYDSTRNESSFWDLDKSCDKPMNGIYGSGSDGRRPLAFPNIKMNCDFNFSVRAATSAEKAAEEKAAADKLAAAKVATEKAASDKAAADKAAADKVAGEYKSSADSRKMMIDNLSAKLMALMIAKPDLKKVIQKTQNSLNSIKVSSSANDDYALKQQLLPIEKQIEALEKLTTITCVKGKVTKRVTAVKPKCPSGYKKK